MGVPASVINTVWQSLSHYDTKLTS